MQVSEGTLGRVLVVRLDHGEDIVESVVSAARQRRVSRAVVWLIGAAGKGRLVVGPKKTELPPERWPVDFGEGRELVGTGTLFPSDGEPYLHIHAATGRGESTLTGCVQKGTAAFLVVEAIIVEILGTEASRKPDPSGEFRLLDAGGNSDPPPPDPVGHAPNPDAQQWKADQS